MLMGFIECAAQTLRLACALRQEWKRRCSFPFLSACGRLAHYHAEYPRAMHPNAGDSERHAPGPPVQEPGVEWVPLGVWTGRTAPLRQSTGHRMDAHPVGRERQVAPPDGGTAPRPVAASRRFHAEVVDCPHSGVICIADISLATARCTFGILPVAALSMPGIATSCN